MTIRVTRRKELPLAFAELAVSTVTSHLTASATTEDLVVMVNMKRPLSCPMLPQVATVICYDVPSYREAAWRVWLVEQSTQPHRCRSTSQVVPVVLVPVVLVPVVPVRWKDAQQGISGSIISRYGGRASLYPLLHLSRFHLSRLLPFALFRTMGPLLLDCRLLNGSVSSKPGREVAAREA